jgi:hypothetical protein
VEAARNAPCPCGSGRKFKRCHGQAPGAAAGEQRKLDALGEVRDLAALFPFLRPGGESFGRFADRAADELGMHDGDIPQEVVEEGMALIDARGRRRLVESFASANGRLWRALCTSVGDPDLAARALVAGAVRAAIGERQLPPRSVLEEAERAEQVIDTPAKALLFLVSGAGVWSILDAAAAGESASGFPLGSPPWLRAVDAVAWEVAGAAHDARFRQLTRHLARRLPLARLPRLSVLLAEACSAVRDDDALVRDLVVNSLATFLVRLDAPAHSYITSPN